VVVLWCGGVVVQRWWWRWTILLTRRMLQHLKSTKLSTKRTAKAIKVVSRGFVRRLHRRSAAAPLRASFGRRECTNQPIQALVEAVAGWRHGWLHVPVTVRDAVKTKVV